MKILGFITNQRVTLDSHIKNVSQRVMMEYLKLKPAFPFMNLEQGKMVMNSLMKSHSNYFSPLMINQKKSKWMKLENMIMRIKKMMFKETTYQVQNAKIVKKLKVKEPDNKTKRSCLMRILRLMKRKK